MSRMTAMPWGTAVRPTMMMPNTASRFVGNGTGDMSRCQSACSRGEPTRLKMMTPVMDVQKNARTFHNDVSPFGGRNLFSCGVELFCCRLGLEVHCVGLECQFRRGVRDKVHGLRHDRAYHADNAERTGCCSVGGAAESVPDVRCDRRHVKLLNGPAGGLWRAAADLDR